MHLVLTSYEGSSLLRMCKRTLHKTPDKRYSYINHTIKLSVFIETVLLRRWVMPVILESCMPSQGRGGAQLLHSPSRFATDTLTLPGLPIWRHSQSNATV